MVPAVSSLNVTVPPDGLAPVTVAVSKTFWFTYAVVGDGTSVVAVLLLTYWIRAGEVLAVSLASPV